LNFAYLYARMYNQISQSIAEDNYPVRLAGYYAGVWGFGGRSHNCINDLAFMRTSTKTPKLLHNNQLIVLDNYLLQYSD
jgi:transketolase C-terminal domain/subunit